MKNFVQWMVLIALLVGCRSETKPTTAKTSPVVESATTPSNDVRPKSTNTLSILSWNVESGGSDPEVIATQLAELGHHDVYCLEEVNAHDFDRYKSVLGTGFESVNSKSGGGDRLEIIFDNNRFELLEQKEMDRYRDHELNNGNHRSPLFVRLRDRVSKVEFIVMTNHLARGKADLRIKQAIGLREWARDQSGVIINVGDFNMDYNFVTKSGNDAFSEMLRDNVWKWVQPKEFIDTNWADPDGDGKDNFPDSMLDFAFVAGPAKDWTPVCKAIVRDGDFPDDKTTSDHRPIQLRLTTPNGN